MSKNLLVITDERRILRMVWEILHLDVEAVHNPRANLDSSTAL